MKKILILIFLLIANYSLLITNCSAQWYQINLPVSGSVYQMQFINSNTGWAMVKHSTYIYSLIMTTNQGTNWQVIYSDSEKVTNFQFINDTLGYAMGYSNLNHLLLKTTNKGFNWSVMQSSQSYVYSGFYMINADTGWVSAFLFPSQVTLMTTNGFQTLQYISSGGGGTPATLYFFKEKYFGEYYGYILGAGILSRTTNSGYNWQQLNFSESGDVNSFSFINKDTGWVVFNPNLGNNSKILYTSNGGLNFIQQFYSNLQYDFGYIQVINSNKIYCGVSSYNKVVITTNGGINWGKQQSQIYANYGIYLFDTLLGFSWAGYQITRTTNGGGPITNIEKISNEIPNKFILKQNYPNPFNSSTVIEFDILKTSVVNLVVYDILGRVIFKIIDSKELNTGSYKTIIDFNDYNLSSGTYFYNLIAYEKTNGNNFQLTKKLVYNK
jgi:photosystem II stability/assembly factor-like uncharacterized protein